MNNNRRTIKSFTRSALLISMVLHFIFLISLFYYIVTDESILPDKDKIAVTLSTVPRPLSQKTPIKPIIRQRIKTKYEATKPLAKVESMNPHNAFDANLAPTTPIVTEQPRLEDTKTSPDVNVNVSTALNQIRPVENGLSTVETAEPTLGSLGTKRSGTQGVHRAPTRSTLNVAGGTGVDSEGATKIGNFLEGKPLLPNIKFSNVIRTLANQIVGTSEGGPIDVVFVIDSSGSMGDNILNVAKHLVNMIDVYESSDIDYALGLSQFSTYRADNHKGPTKNAIQILQLTKDMKEYKREIHDIIVREDENALDAIVKTVNKMRFRATSKKHLIVVTDEPFTSIEGRTLKDAIDICREFGVYVNVLGLPEKEHQELASETNGKWHEIPGERNTRLIAQERSTASTLSTKDNLLKKARWENLQRVGIGLIQNARNEPVDIVLFIDGSKSMEDKLPHFLKQFDVWVRDWDNALLNYQLGVVRFSSNDSDNTVDVFNPPQSLVQVRQTIELPCQDDEYLLHAIAKGYNQLELRHEAKTHLILVTDEPIKQTSKYTDVIQFLEKKHVVVSVVGTFDDFQEEVTLKTGGVWVPIPQGHLVDDENW